MLAAHPAAAGPDVRARDELPRLEHRLADGADARAVRPGRQLDLGRRGGRSTPTWAGRPPAATTCTASSPCAVDVVLPELERFPSTSSPASPTITVRVGGPAGDRPPDPAGPADAHPARIAYAESLRRLGFGVDIARGDRFEVRGLAARRALAARPLHERRRADPALDVRRARLRARARRLPRGGRRRVPLTARTDTGKTTTSLKILDSAAVLVPVRRPDAAVPGRAGAHLPQAADHQPAHAARRQDAAPHPPRAAGPRRPEPAALPLRAALRAPAGQDPPARGDDQRDRPAARPAAEVPRRAPGAGRGRGARGAGSRAWS